MLRTSMKTPPKRSRSRRNLMRIYDQRNDEAAKIILGDPERHTRFQISWAQKIRGPPETREPGGGELMTATEIRQAREAK